MLLALPACSAWLLGADSDAPASTAVADSGPKPPVVRPPVTLGDGGVCSSDRAQCGAQCVDRTDPAYGCGASDCAACPSAPSNGYAVCSATACDIACSDGFRLEGSACVPDTTGCANGLTRCSGECVDLQTDRAHCGSCAAAACTDTAFGTAVCAAGSCTASCKADALLVDGQCAGWTAWARDASGDNLFSVWMVGAGEAWAVGSNGALLHLEPGGSVTPASRPQRNPLRSVWGSGPNDVWAVGDKGTILHKGAGAWAPVVSATALDLNTIWGSSSSDLWIGGNEGLVMHKVGSGSWSIVQQPTQTYHISSISGSGPNDVWLVHGYRKTVQRSTDGSTFSSIAAPYDVGPGRIWATVPGEVWLIPGSMSSSSRRVGASWVPLTAAAGGLQLFALWGSSASDVWAVGARGITWRSVDGATWRAINSPPDEDLNSVHGTGPLDIYSVGANAGVYHFGP